MDRKTDLLNGKTKILIAEDSPTQAVRLKYILEQEGYKVIAAPDGNQALDLIKENMPTIIISDIVMPGMDGYELCRKIKSDEHTMDIPVILLTSLARTEDVLEGLACGADNFVTKPYSEDYLLTIISKILANNKIRKTERVRIGMEVLIGGNKRFITADQQQMLSLLLSTYEAAVQRNIELTETQEQLRSLNEHLEDLVNERTADLSREIIERKRSEEREKHINIILRSIRAVNQLIVREKDRGRLIQSACSELVDERGFNGVWIVLTDQLPVRLDTAQKGFQEKTFSEFVNLIKESGKSVCPHQSKTDSGLITNRNNHEVCEGCPLAGAHEKATSLSICIEHGEKYYGSMGFSIPPIYDEGEEENSLVKEIAGDIAFALYNIDLEEKQNIMIKELSYSEARYKALFDGAVEGILIADIQTKKYKYANPAICKMLGFTEDELKRMNINEIHPKEDHDHVISDIDIIVKKGKKLVRNLKCQRKDGKIFYADFNTNICQIDGKSCIVAFIADISGIRSLEQQLQQSQKLEAIGKLSGGIAHDFNNLLTTVIGNSELLLLDTPKDHPSREEIKEIKHAGERAAALTRQLLAFSRKQVFQPDVINLNDTTLAMDKMLRRLIGENIKLKTILAPDLGKIEADVGQIEQVIMNLVVNARDAMPKGGKITVETGNVELDENYASSHVAVVPGPYVLLSVSDTGCGMKKEIVEQVFDPFFTTKGKGKGTGLGLSTVYGIVKQSKGYIWVYSEPGRGSTFKAYFPWIEKSASIKKPKNDKAVNLLGSETILLVEDDELVRNFTEKALKGFGYEVLIAVDGQEAIQIFENHDQPIHLVLTDVVMPGMSGGVLEEKLKFFAEGVKVIYMSGYTDNAIVHHGVLDRGKVFLQKPFTSEVLGRKVREVLDI